MNNRLLAMLAVVLVTSGCSGEKADGGSVATTRAPVAPGADAVAAVLQSTGTPVAKLAYALVGAPVVGAPSEVRLDVTAVAAVPDLQVRTEAQALTIDQASAAAIVPLEAGKTSSHQVKFTPQREGLTEMTIRLRAGTDGSEAVYVIPVLVAAIAAGA